MGSRAYTSLSGQAYPNVSEDEIDSFITMDISDGTWTFSDPLGMIDTYANNEIRLNTITNDALQPNVNPSQAPRWSKLATYADGSPVLGGDKFILTIETNLNGSTSGVLRYIRQMFGVAEAVTQNVDPLVINKWSGVGQSWGFSNTSADATGIILQGSTVTVISASAIDVKVFGTVSVIGRSANNTIVGLDGAGQNDGSNANDFSGGLYAAAGQLYLVYLFGANGAGRSYNAGDGTDISYIYKFTKIITE